MTGTLNVGFIGVGLMGHGIAGNLLKNGIGVTFLDHPGNQPVSDILELGAISQASIREVVAGRPVVFLCVTGSRQVEDIVLGENGIAEHLLGDAVLVDCSTIEPQTTHKVATEIESRAAHYLDAPLTRTPREAEAGKLNLMVGGRQEILERVRPLLETFAENIYHAGPTGAGHTLKLLHNFISLGNCALLAEAVVAARRSHVDLETFVEVLASGGGGSVALERLTPYVLHGDEGGFRFSLDNCRKDLTYYTALADDLNITSLAAHAIQQLFNFAAGLGAGSRPVPHLIDLLQELGDRP